MNLTEKSRITSFCLTFFFGPLGLFYSSTGAALALILVAVIGFATVVVPLFVWVFSIALGDHLTYKHNKNLEAFKQLMTAKGGA